MVVRTTLVRSLRAQLVRDLARATTVFFRHATRPAVPLSDTGRPPLLGADSEPCELERIVACQRYAICHWRSALITSRFCTRPQTVCGRVQNSEVMRALLRARRIWGTHLSVLSVQGGLHDR